VSLVVLVPVSTVLHSVSLAPPVTSVVPVDVRSSAMMLVNAVVLVAGIVLATPSVRQRVSDPA
jgi:hypothetical protein